jgi:hypothetical protein
VRIKWNSNVVDKELNSAFCKHADEISFVMRGYFMINSTAIGFLRKTPVLTSNKHKKRQMEGICVCKYLSF